MTQLPRNLVERRKGRKSVGSKGRREGKKKGTLEKYRVSDSGEEGE
jgi:hypothetical protein